MKNASTGTAPYEAGAQTRRTKGWTAPTIGPNNATLATLTTLRDRSRAAARNDGFAKGIIDKLVSNLIGTGIKPRSLADDKAFRKAVLSLWNQWTDESDADGLLDFYGQQSQACRAWLEGGEVFIRLRPRLASDGLSVPLQLQILEPELCPHAYTLRAANGNKIRAGIEFDAIGRRVAYWMYPSHPGEFQDADSSTLRRVPAAGVLHLYDPLRPGQLRGLPHLSQALIRLYELDKFDDATLLRQQIQNLFAGFLTSTGASTGNIDPLTGEARDTSNTPPLVSLEPGTLQQLAPGEEITFAEPKGVSDGYKDFMRQQLMNACAATGVPYEVLTGDMSGMNDRVIRVILHEFRRRLLMVQHQVLAYQFCRPIWNEWLDRVFLSGALDIPSAYATDPEPWARVKWNPQAWPYLHPVQDIEAIQAAIRIGVTSREAEVAALGEDIEEIDDTQAADNARADKLGLRYDSDGRQAKTPKNSMTDPAIEPPTTSS